VRFAIRLFFAAVAIALATGCATLAHGTSQAVPVTSAPSGARVFVNGKLAGTTPLKLDLARWRKGTVLRLEKDGFVPQEMALHRTVSGWTMGNLIAANPMARQGYPNSEYSYSAMAATGLAVGIGIDFLFGGAFQFPKKVGVTLDPAVVR
jgi:hypothetical protein